MRCVVTGVAGFVGSTLAERLVADGHDVLGVDCFTDYYDRETKERNLAVLRAGPRFELATADLADAAIAPLVDGAEVVFHQAAQAGVRASWGETFASYVRWNVLATQRLLEATKALSGRGGPRRVVYASSSSVYGETEDLPMRETSFCRPYSPYGVTKLAAEHLCELYRNNFGISTVSLRYFTVYGPRQRPDMGFHKFCRAVLRGEPIVQFGDGTQTRDFTFIDDVVEANVKSATSAADGVFNIGGGSRVTLAHVLETLDGIAAEAGVGRVRITPIDKQPGDVTHTDADASRANRELGWSPKVPLAEGLARQLAWHREVHGRG